LVGHVRGNAVADLLAAALDGGLDASLEPTWWPLLLPLLGHQRRACDFQLLTRLALQPGPLRVRRAALEGLSLGLSVWPLAALGRTLDILARDLDPLLAVAAVDSLARLPRARSPLLRLRRSPLDASVAARLERRLRALPANPLLLVVHGRADGVIPPLLHSLAVELERRRGAPVLLRALTDPQPLSPQPLRGTLTLVPLFLLPGGHVRHDLPAMAAALRRQGPVRVLPFLGSWPRFQQVLAEEIERGAGDGGVPGLLHHRVDGPLPRRYLAHLERVAGGSCLTTPQSPAELAALVRSRPGGLIPLTLGPSRLSEALIPIVGAEAGAPLLARPLIWAMVLDALEELP
jgi:sirohydrochlorin ferrochelatase